MKARNPEQAFRSIQARVRQPGRKRYTGIHEFRSSYDDRTYFSAYRRLFPYENSLKDYHGNPFPKTANQLFSNKTPRSQLPAYRELLWTIARCQRFSVQLKDFLKERLSFENAVLEEDFERASHHLSVVDGKFGKSVWYFQNRIASGFVSKDTGQASLLADSVAEEVTANTFLNALLHFSRRRAEGAVLRDQLKQEISKITGDSVRTYFQAKIYGNTDSSDEAVAGRLDFDGQASVIDHYESLIVSLQTGTSDNVFPPEMLSVLRTGVKLLFKEIGDPRLAGVLLAMDSNTDYVASSVLDLRAEAIECYTAGDYAKCASIAEGILASSPSDSSMRVLKAKAHVASGVPMPPGNGLQSQVDQHLFNVLSANEEYFPSTHALLVLADRFYDHDWMQRIRIAVYHEIGPEQEKFQRSWFRDIYVRDPYLTPFSALAIQNTASLKVLESEVLRTAYPVTCEVVVEALADSPSTPLTSRSARYRARRLLSEKQYDEAARLYSYAAKHESRAALKLRAFGGAALAQMLAGRSDEAVETLARAHIENPNAPTLLPFANVVELLPEVERWPKTLSLGLVLDLDAQFQDEQDLSKQRLAFENFCLEHHVECPTRLVELFEQEDPDLVSAYLDRVWRPEVMQQTLLYSDADSIQEARIEACRILQKLDAKNGRAHQEELASRIKQQEISKATTLVEQSKVHVDIETIKRALKSKLGNSYAQYKNSFSQVTKSVDAFVDIVADALAKMDTTDSTSLSNFLSSVHLLGPKEAMTQAELQFNAIFSEITKEFLTGDHGLNAYLSTRVRHGKMVDAMRKTVMDEHLVTAKDEKDKYLPNQYWRRMLVGIDCVDAMESVLERFAARFDTTLNHIRDRLIQIRIVNDLRISNENAEGLFDYQFSALERRLMQSYDRSYKDFEELISKCVDTLWEKTDKNLDRVRRYFDETARASVIGHFDTLDAELRDLFADTVPSLLANSVARARTGTQQALDGVIAWFKRSEVYDRQDFEIDLPAQIASVMVTRTMSIGRPWGGPHLSAVSADAKIPGRALDGLVDIFYAIFENAVKYAERIDILLKVDVELQYLCGEFVATVASNALSPTDDDLERLEDLRKTLAAAESRRLAQSEGRSGFRKIWIALDNQLYKSPSLEFTHEATGKFRVVIKFRTGSTE